MIKYTVVKSRIYGPCGKYTVRAENKRSLRRKVYGPWTVRIFKKEKNHKMEIKDCFEKNIKNNVKK